MASPQKSSHFQEDALAVEGVEENPADANITRRLKEGLQVLGQEGKETAEDLRGGIGEIDELLGEVNGDAVHADDREEKSPATPAPHINEPVEEGKHKQ